MGLWKFFGPPKPPSEPEDTSAQYTILRSNRGWRAVVSTWEAATWVQGRLHGYWLAGCWRANDLNAEGWPVELTRVLPTREAAVAAIEQHRSGVSTWQVDKGA